MRKVIVLFFWILCLWACKNEEKESLNSLSEQDFEDFIYNGIKERKGEREGILVYIDSIVSLPNLKDDYRARTLLWEVVLSYKEKKFDEAILKASEVYELVGDRENAILVNYYYIMGLIEKKQNKFYQSLYYFDKAGEILKKTDIYHTKPAKADIMLLHIALANRDLMLNEKTKEYLLEALNKHNKFSLESPKFMYDNYVLMSGLFSSRSMLNRDSMYYYLSLAEDIVGYHPNVTQKDNVNYIKSEYFYNTSQIDSSLFYLKTISRSTLDLIVTDEINLLSIYSRKGLLAKADLELAKLRKFSQENRLSANDSLLLFENMIEYNLRKKNFKESLRALKKFADYKEKFDNREVKKNIGELASILDLSQKDKELKRTKSEYRFAVRLRNSILALVLALLIGVVLLGLYLRTNSIKNRLKVEAETTNLKMKLLQSQIKPHFVFNALASIQGLIREKENDKSIHYLNVFSDLMRAVLDVGRSNQVTLASELDILKRYSELQKLKQDNFDLHITLKGELNNYQEDVLLPTLSLQPFIENSIIHGFKGINYRGCIDVIGEIKGQFLHLFIIDNGKGFQPKNNGENSHGLAIIREQFANLDKKLKQKTELLVKNRDVDNGTEIELKIPLVFLV